MSYEVVDTVPGFTPEGLAELQAKAEAGFSPEELGPERLGPGAFLEVLAPDVRQAIIDRLDLHSSTPINEQISNLLRPLLAA